MSEIKCSDCDAKLTFGGASGAYAKEPPRSLVESMALNIGWRKSAGKWRCRNHG